MRPVLFVVPLSAINSSLPDVPVYGYGLMLFFAYLFCTALGRRLCKRQGIDGALIPDLAIWLFVSGIIGGRLVFVVQFWHSDANNIGFDQRPLWETIKLWDGGLVLYGALAGAALGFFAFNHFVLRRHHVATWKMIDIVAVCVPLGIALGRMGCLFTGCCYGDVACARSPELHFPIHSPAWGKMVQLGYQSPLGFLLKEHTFTVEAVEPGSAAAVADLRPGDQIVKVNGKKVEPLVNVAPGKGEQDLTLEIARADGLHEIAFAPTSIGVNPTQIYETISMCLLLFFLLSYFPYRRHDGEMLVLLMIGYGMHRFLNEMLRIDNEPVAFGLTLSQNVSIGVLIAAAVLAVVVWRRPLLAATPTLP